MATDYGADLPALSDLPSSDALVSGELAAAYAICRRWLTPAGGLSDAGIDADYDSFDVREYMGGRVTSAVIDEITRAAERVAAADMRVDAVSVVVTFASGALSLAATATGDEGPFQFVLSVDDVSASLILEP